MRRLKKFKKYNFYNKSKLNHSIFSKLPVKINSLKKSKWNLLKQFDKYSSTKIFINNGVSNLKSLNQEWSMLRNFYRDSLFVKNNINIYFDNNFKSKFWKKLLRDKKSLNKQTLFLLCLVYPEFRLDILLWRLDYFKSPFQSRQAINQNLISVNDNFVSGNYLLKKGDVVKILTNKIEVSISNSIKFFPFVEIDYYSKTIVVLCNWNDLKFEECFYFINQLFDLRKFKSFFS